VQVETRLPVSKPESCVLALGNFDGVHLGHSRLLNKGLEEAKRRGAKLAVLLFEPHPFQVLFPERELKLLTTQQEQLNIFETLGVEIVYVLPFTAQTAGMSPEQFVAEVIVRLGAVHVVVGFNYSFGAQGRGDSAYLRAQGQKYGFEVSILQAQIINGKIISSSSIRKALLHGDVAIAQEMLGYPPCLCGQVVEGEARGRLLGYPTANLHLSLDQLVPKRGVYAVWTELGGDIVNGMMNIGMKPTFHDHHETTVEVHFFNLEQNLYGQLIKVSIVARLRDERKFAGIDELTSQLEKDAQQARRILISRTRD